MSKYPTVTVQDILRELFNLYVEDPTSERFEEIVTYLKHYGQTYGDIPIDDIDDYYPDVF